MVRSFRLDPGFEGLAPVFQLWDQNLAADLSEVSLGELLEGFPGSVSFFRVPIREFPKIGTLI